MPCAECSRWVADPVWRCRGRPRAGEILRFAAWVEDDMGNVWVTRCPSCEHELLLAELVEQLIAAIDRLTVASSGLTTWAAASPWRRAEARR